MKRLLASLLGLFLVFAPVALAEVGNWHVANQTTVAWDAVTVLSDGSPLPTGDTIEYKIYLANSVTDPSKTNPVEVGRTAALQFTITLGTEGRFLVGFQSIRISGGADVGESVIAWSDDPAACLNNETFGLVYFLPPGKVGGARPM